MNEVKIEVIVKLPKPHVIEARWSSFLHLRSTIELDVFWIAVFWIFTFLRDQNLDCKQSFKIPFSNFAYGRSNAKPVLSFVNTPGPRLPIFKICFYSFKTCFYIPQNMFLYPQNLFYISKIRF